MVQRCVLGLLLIGLVLPRAAHADAPGATPPAPPAEVAPPAYAWGQAIQPAPALAQHWYRGSMVLADVAATGLLLGAMYEENGHGDGKVWWLLAPGIGFATLGPLVHMAHGNHAGAAESVALRVGLPLLGAFLGYAGFHCTGSECYDGTNDTEYEVLGGLAGAVAAAVIDDSALARVAVSERSWAPVVVPAPHGGATLGIAGSF